jgi:D-alanine--poly(phosphoribitol) ligase subunit 2
MTTSDIVLDELEKITGTDEVRQNLDLALFEESYLDSLGTVELIVSLGDILSINLTPAMVDRKMWATPRKIIADIETRLKP